MTIISTIYSHSNHTSPSFPPECSIIQLPKSGTSPDDADLYALLTADFNLEVHASRGCVSCYNRGSQCQNSGGEEFTCAGGKEGLFFLKSAKKGM